MQAPKLTYEQTKRIDGIEDYAYERLFTNYLKLDIKGGKKLIEIDSTDQESILNQKANGLPFMGLIYTFIHINNKTLEVIQNAATGNSIEYHDFTPILFCTNFNVHTGVIKGLNLNMLPQSERLKFLQVYWEFYKPFFEKIEEKTEYNKEAINSKYVSAAASGQNPKLFDMFNKSQSALFNFAYRSYDLKNIRKFRMIEYEEWKFIPFYDARQSFKKTNLEALYSLYYKTNTRS